MASCIFFDASIYWNDFGYNSRKVGRADDKSDIFCLMRLSDVALNDTAFMRLFEVVIPEIPIGPVKLIAVEPFRFIVGFVSVVVVVLCVYFVEPITFILTVLFVNVVVPSFCVYLTVPNELIFIVSFVNDVALLLTVIKVLLL